MDFTNVVITLLLSVGLTQESNVSSKQTLYVLSQLPYTIPNSAGLLPSWQEGAPVAQALNLAAWQINNRTDLLPNYNLELEHINGGCDFVDVAVTNFTEGVASLLERKDRRFVALIGPGCSTSTQGVTALTNRPSINIVTIHGAGASVYSDRNMYPYSFGTLGSNGGFGELAVALMRKTNWRKIGILFQDVRLYYATLKREIVSAVKYQHPDAEIVFSSMVRLNNFYPLDDLKNSRARIIFVVTPPEHSRQIMCLAYHMGLIYPGYQWILAGRTIGDFLGVDKVSFTYDEKHYVCSHKNLEAALNNSFFMNYRLIPFDQSVESVAGLNYTEYYELYKQEVEVYNSDYTNPFTNISTTIWAAYFYDALWALAIALHNVTEKHHLNLSEYQYKDENITQLIAEELYNVDFNGNSGPINFSRETGFVVREIDLTQIVNYTEVFTAYSDAGVIVKVRPFDFIDDEFEVQNLPAYQGVAAFFGVVVSIQLLVVITLHILTVVYRNEKSVRASSPNLNHIAYVGIYLLVVALMLNSINEHPTFDDVSRAGLCQAMWAWFLPISFTLALGPVVVRTWRLYRIFTHYLDPGPFISTPVLVTIVCIMFAVDLLIAIIWTSTDAFRLLEVESTVSEEGATTLLIRLRCRCDYYFLWLGAIMIYKLATLVVLFVFALLTRNIKNQSFTTASLRVFGYLMIIIFGLGFTTYYLFLFAAYNITIDFSILCITLNTMLLAFTVCVFLPPLVPPLREKIKKYRLGKLELKDVWKSDVTRKTSVASFASDIAIL